MGSLHRAARREPYRLGDRFGQLQSPALFRGYFTQPCAFM
jgi:hypothetical protein